MVGLLAAEKRKDAELATEMRKSAELAASAAQKQRGLSRAS
jgi:hypothetical protein